MQEMWFKESNTTLEPIIDEARDEVRTFLRSLNAVYIDPKVRSIVNGIFSGYDTISPGWSGWVEIDNDFILKEKQLVVVCLILWQEYDWFVKEMPLLSRYSKQINIDKFKTNFLLLGSLYNLFTKSLKKEYPQVYRKVGSLVTRQPNEEILSSRTCLKVYYELAREADYVMSSRHLSDGRNF